MRAKTKTIEHLQRAHPDDCIHIYSIRVVKMDKMKLSGLYPFAIIVSSTIIYSPSSKHCSE